MFSLSLLASLRTKELGQKVYHYSLQILGKVLSTFLSLLRTTPPKIDNTKYKAALIVHRPILPYSLPTEGSQK